MKNEKRFRGYKLWSYVDDILKSKQEPDQALPHHDYMNALEANRARLWGAQEILQKRLRSPLRNAIRCSLVDVHVEWYPYSMRLRVQCDGGIVSTQIPYVRRGVVITLESFQDQVVAFIDLARRAHGCVS